MKKAKLIAREEIIGVNDDNGLKALDGYFETPFYEIAKDDSYEVVFDYLYSKHKDEIDKLFSPSFDIVFEPINQQLQ